MSLQKHIAGLRRRHKALSGNIEDAQRCPGFCSLKLSEMKREKLRLKEEIARLEEVERRQILEQLTGETYTPMVRVGEVPMLQMPVEVPCDTDSPAMAAE